MCPPLRPGQDPSELARHVFRLYAVILGFWMLIALTGIPVFVWLLYSIMRHW